MRNIRIAYQAATPDVAPAFTVTAYQGDMETSFKHIKECGYDGIELMVCDPGKIDAGHIADLSKKYDLAVPMVCTGEVFGQGGVCFSSLDDAVRNEAIRRAKDAVDLAQNLGAQVNIGRLRGTNQYTALSGQCRSRSVDGMRTVAQYAQAKGVIVALEPVNSLLIDFINTTQEGISMLDEIGCDALKLMVDTNHLFIGERDIIQSVYDAKDYLSYVHLADSNRFYPGHCKLDFETFFQALEDIGYRGWVGVEVFQRPDQETALKRSYKTIRPLL